MILADKFGHIVVEAQWNEKNGYKLLIVFADIEFRLFSILKAFRY
ncbi:protein of unknown function [Bartonella clarridgeiae 73]|uniref:Uncharacterized protein n=1 Tax=Bartonella clarridgeiae (strain CCUG 45776 / CIP 104772 / 73) TaxID=696125 RepID=E6YGL0_BARC7|nr:protein of unknown function [Bartonella clarridgeiae 73]